jgi:hypothetical protein
MSLLWVTSPSKEEADMYKTRMDEYRWKLRLFSKTTEYLERAIGMLATSTDVLMKEVPERPNADFMLNRNLARASRGLWTTHHLEDTSSQVNSIMYQSESEDHGGISPEIRFEETASGGGIASGEWIDEQGWFTNTARNGQDILGASDGANGFLQMPELDSPQNDGLQY